MAEKLWTNEDKEHIGVFLDMEKQDLLRLEKQKDGTMKLWLYDGRRDDHVPTVLQADKKRMLVALQRLAHFCENA